MIWKKSDPRGPRARPSDKGQDQEALRRQPARRRVWLFRLAALVLGPVLFLGLLELGLRIAGYGFNPHVAVNCQVDGTPCLGENVAFGWRFFAPVLAQEFEPFAFPVRKRPNTCRIFVLGESAAQGIPNGSFCFGRLLEVMLRQRFPDLHFEVITVAMSAINSHAVLPVARDCARYDPDLFVVYLGNNEVVGPYGPGTVFTPVLSSLRLIRWSIGLRATKTGQLLRALLGGQEPRKEGPRYWKGLEMCLAEKIPADDPRLKVVYGHFQRNLEDICRVAARAGARTILCTVGTNLRDCPPFGSAHRPDLTPEQQGGWDALYHEGVQCEQRGDYARAVEGYLRAAQDDDSYAELHFRLGRCYRLLGDDDRARTHYVRARDLDTLRFRADTRINEVIRAVAGRWQQEGVYFADVVAALNEGGPAGLAGGELFYEHVHLTFEGNYTVATTVLRQAERALSVRFKEGPGRRGPVPTLAQCAEALAYNEWSRCEAYRTLLHSSLTKPPFTGQLDHEARLEQQQQYLDRLEQGLTPPVLQTVCGQYQRAIAEAPADWRLRWDYGKLLAEDLRQYETAVTQYKAVLRFLAHSYIAHEALATVLRVTGDLNAAMAEYHKVLAIKPISGDAHYYLGWCHQRQGQTEAAMSRYRKAIRYAPTCVPAYLGLGELLVRQGRRQEAVQLCRAGLAASPDNALLHCNLGMVLIKIGDREEGVKEIRRALELDPDSPRIRGVAEALLGPGAL